MERHSRLSVILLSFLVIAGCSGRREMAAHLSDIASYINDKPDSALAELRAIDTTLFHSRRNKAQHSLLHAMALDKCYINVTSDSIISPAARYYRHHGSADNKLKALFYQGKVYQYRHEYGDAAILFSKAEDLTNKAEDAHAIGLLYLTFSEIYRKVYNIDKQQEYNERALAALSGTDDPLYEGVFAQLAIPYMMRREWNTADSLFRRAMMSCDSNPHVMMYIINSYGRMKMMQDNPDPEGAITLFKRKIGDYGGSLTPAEAGAYAYASARLGDNATADALILRLKGLKNEDWLTVLPWMYRIYAWRGDYLSAYYFLSEAHLNEENTVQSTLTDSVTQALQDYRERSLEQERDKRRTASLIFVSLLLLATVIILVTVLRKRSVQHEMDSLLNIHESLKMEHEALIASAEKKAINLRNKNRERIKSLQMQLQKERIESFRQRRVYDYVLWMNENRLMSDTNTLKEFKKEIMSFYRIERNQEELEKVLDTALDGMLARLKKDLGINNAKDVHFLCLWLMDTKPIVVSEILGMNENMVYIKRSRLKGRINNLGEQYRFLVE